MCLRLDCDFIRTHPNLWVYKNVFTHLSYVNRISFLFIYDKIEIDFSANYVISKQAHLHLTEWVVRKDYATKQKITIENASERNYKEY